jgi:small subunit ribosomal protein S3
MALEKKFIKESIRNLDVEEYLSKEFARAEYSHCEIQRTPLSIRVTVYAHKPGIIIGRGGKNIDFISQILKEKFGFENPQLDVQEVREPNLDPFIVSRWIASSIERNVNYKRVVNLAIEKVMSAGGVGVAIRISGKIGGDMSRTEKFSAGYLKYSGEPAETDVLTAYAQANVKLGVIGIQVRICINPPKELELMRQIEEGAVAAQAVAAEAAKAQEKAEIKPEEAKAEPKAEEAKIEPKTEEAKEEIIEETEEEIEMEVEDLGDIKEEATK